MQQPPEHPDTIRRTAAAAVSPEDDARFRHMADAIPEQVWITDAQGRVTYLNKRWTDYCGVPFGPTTAAQIAVDFLHPEDAPDVMAAFAEAIRTGGVFEVEQRNRSASGEYRWFLNRGAPYRDPRTGETTRWIGVGVDIHDRKQAEAELRSSAEALRASEERLRTFVNASSDVVYRMSPDWSEMRRLDGKGFIADTEAPSVLWLEEYIFPEDRPQVMGAIREAVERKAVFQLEHRVRRADGGVGWTSSRAVPLLDRAGEVVEWFGTASDVTARRQAEETLAEQRRLYEAILTNTPDLAYIFDLSHRFIYANDVLLRMWGRTWDEAIGKNCLELGYPQWHAEMHDREIEQVIATKRPVRGEVPFAGTFGRRIYDYLLVPVLGEGGEVVAVAGTTRDVTDSRQAEEALREAAQKNERIAETLQRSLLIAPDPAWLPPGLDIGTEYQAAWDEALIGGDFFDAFALDGGGVALVVGDATGKGLRAAEHVAEVKYALRAFLREDAVATGHADPARALARLNLFTCAGQRLGDGKGGAYVAVVVAVLDPRTGEGACAAAGMEPPLVLRAASISAAEEVEVSGPLIGMEDGVAYETARFALAEGDQLALATDGVTEARRAREVSAAAGLAAALREAAAPGAPLPEVARAAVTRAVAFAGGRRGDDMCLLLARRCPREEGAT